LGLGWEE
jgi:hypothetical protein